MYKFQRVNEGPLRGCYHHPNFSRDRFDLIDKINRKDRGDEDCSSSAGGARTSPFTSRFRKKTGKLSVRKTIEDLLSGSDSDTAASDDNDLQCNESGAGYDDYIPISLSSDKCKEGLESSYTGASNQITLHKEGSMSMATCTTFDPSCDRIGNQSGLFDMREDFSTKSEMPPHVAFPSTIFLEPLHVPGPFCGAHKGLPLSSNSTLELSVPFVSSPPTDIMEEIIRTFSILPSEP